MALCVTCGQDMELGVAATCDSRVEADFCTGGGGARTRLWLLERVWCGVRDARVVRVIPPCGAKRQPHVLKFIHMGTEGQQRQIQKSRYCKELWCVQAQTCEQY